MAASNTSIADRLAPFSFSMTHDAIYELAALAVVVSSMCNESFDTRRIGNAYESQINRLFCVLESQTEAEEEKKRAFATLTVIANVDEKSIEELENFIVERVINDPDDLYMWRVHIYAFYTKVLKEHNYNRDAIGQLPWTSEDTNYGYAF